MRRLHPGALLAVAPAAILAALISLLAFSGSAPAQEMCADPGYATDHIIVKMRAGASAESLEGMKALNGEGGERLMHLSGVWVVDVPVGRTAPEAVGLYGAIPDVEYAELDPIATLDEPCGERGASIWITGFTDSADPTHVGDDLAYEATVRNYGPDPAVNARLYSSLPDGVEFVSAGFSKGGTSEACPSNDREFSCALGGMGVDEEAKVTLVVRPNRVDAALGIVFDYMADNALIHYYHESEHTTVLPSADSRGCTMMGSARSDRLLGTDGRDVICGGRGNDTIIGAHGDDVLYGGYGADTLSGGTGGDRLFGWHGQDALRARDGSEGNDTGRGGPARDRVVADNADRVRD